MNDQDILQRINYEINKRFDERDKSFDRIEPCYGYFIL